MKIASKSFVLVASGVNPFDYCIRCRAIDVAMQQKLAHIYSEYGLPEEGLCL